MNETPHCEGGLVFLSSVTGLVKGKLLKSSGSHILMRLAGMVLVAWPVAHGPAMNRAWSTARAGWWQMDDGSRTSGLE